MLYGPSGCGKSVTIGKILGHVADSEQGLTALVDVDHTADGAVAFWGPVGDLQEAVLIHEPRSSEEALIVAEALTRAADLVVVDSFGGFETEPGNRMVGEAARRLSVAAADSGCAVLVTNQIRMDLKRRREKPYGDTRVMYHAHRVIRLEAHPLREKGVRVGVRIAGFLEKSFDGPLKGASETWDLEYLT